MLRKAKTKKDKRLSIYLINFVALDACCAIYQEDRRMLSWDKQSFGRCSHLSTSIYQYINVPVQSTSIYQFCNISEEDRHMQSWDKQSLGRGSHLSFVSFRFCTRPLYKQLFSLSRYNISHAYPCESTLLQGIT